MLSEYLPIIVFLVVGFGLGIVLLSLGAMLGPRSSSNVKNSAYECGFEAFDDARMRFDVRFYLLAILFIVFDLEVAFLVPWAVVLDELGTQGLVLMGSFLGILTLGFAYVWKKGALEWE
jgi:NADH-quinone oxidoreductase subunit A